MFKPMIAERLVWSVDISQWDDSLIQDLLHEEQRKFLTQGERKD
jgi:hypothetical protein